MNEIVAELKEIIKYSLKNNIDLKGKVIMMKGDKFIVVKFKKSILGKANIK